MTSLSHISPDHILAIAVRLLTSISIRMRMLGLRQTKSATEISYIKSLKHSSLGYSISLHIAQ